MNDCSVENCDREVRCKGLCQSHYMKQWHADHPEAYRRDLVRWSAHGNAHQPENRPYVYRERRNGASGADTSKKYIVPGETFSERMVEYRKIYERAKARR